MTATDTPLVTLPQEMHQQMLESLNWINNAPSHFDLNSVSEQMFELSQEMLLLLVSPDLPTTDEAGDVLFYDLHVKDGVLHVCYPSGDALITERTFPVIPRAE